MAKQLKIGLRQIKGMLRESVMPSVLMYLADQRLTAKGVAERSKRYHDLVAGTSLTSSKHTETLANFGVIVVDSKFPYSLTWKGSAPFTLVNADMLDMANRVLDQAGPAYWERITSEVANDNQEIQTSDVAEAQG